MTELFNTPFETSLRVLLLLETEARTDFSINMIACVDFAALYGKSFDISEMNLHGDNLFKFSEFATRKELTRDGMAFLVRRGFVDVNPRRMVLSIRYPPREKNSRSSLIRSILKITEDKSLLP